MQQVDKMFLMGSSFPSKEFTRGRLHTQVMLSQFARIQRSSPKEEASSSGIPGGASNPAALLLSIVCRSWITSCFSKGLSGLEEAGLFENSVAFKWAIRAEEKIFQLIAIYPDLTGKRKIFFFLYPIAMF